MTGFEVNTDGELLEITDNIYCAYANGFPVIGLELLSNIPPSIKPTEGDISTLKDDPYMRYWRSRE